MSRPGDRQRVRHRRAAMRQREERLLATSRPNPARITAALDAAGLYGPEVDEACGVAEPAVDRWESGELVPTADQVRALAKLAGVTPAFLYGEYEPLPVWLCGEDGCEYVDPRPGGDASPPIRPPTGSGDGGKPSQALAEVIPLRRTPRRAG